MLDTIKFKEDAMAICVKCNLPEDEEEWDEYISIRWLTILEYLAHYAYTIYASSGGIHMKGKAETPHFHLHFVLSKTGVKTPRPSNPSKHRGDWLKRVLKPGNIIDYTFEDCKFEYSDSLDKKKAEYNVLSYPLKEGRLLDRSYYRYNGEPMQQEMLDALLQYSKAVYEGEEAVQARRLKSQENSMCRKNDILKCAKEHRDLFSTYREMLLVLDARYINKLPFNDKPRPQEYKINCQIVAVELGLLSYSELC